MILTQLEKFRQAIYDSLGKAKDAVFELMDAVLTSPSIPSFVSLSQSPVFRRQWSSIYAALHDSRLPKMLLMKLLVQEVVTDEQPFLAGDHSFWARPEAKTLKERTFYGDRGGSIGIGQSYSTLAWIPEADGSWALPLKHERITSFETPTSKAAFQLKLVTRELGKRPLAAYDRGYGNAKFVQATEKIDADLLLRLASNRCVWGTPGTYKGRGAPCKHGHKFKLNDPETWPVATETLEVEDPKVGRVKVMRWSGFHFLQSPNRAMEIIRVEVIKPVGRNRKFQPLWLAWLGQTMPVLEDLWHKYLRRFALEHWYRFAKQRLYWTQPQLSSTRAAERWSDLMPLLTWQLWFARVACIDSPLPWQSTQDKLSPGRVAQAFPLILATIGTPAQPPKTRGKSPGRAQGHQPPSRKRYPTVKKHASKKPKTEESLKNADLTAA
ncbi:NF041680 family putative transposase [Nostoc sp.]|uniref:NF041680 family putative transposase n=1 Tax=Nostoc sp. TaxID=1180 RepID=UPI0035939CCF